MLADLAGPGVMGILGGLENENSYTIKVAIAGIQWRFTRRHPGEDLRFRPFLQPTSQCVSEWRHAHDGFAPGALQPFL